MNSNSNIRGKVVIAGAGPGDPELITVKVARYLQQADVVLSDRLVSEKILETYVRKDAEIIHVGKQCRRGVSTPQQTINELIVKYALQGKFVVRLKGGDVSIFSNIMDELETLVVNDISYEIVPGVTAALGAAATADHKTVQPVQFLFSSFFTAVAIILLVHSMKFYQCLVIFTNGAGNFIL
jgi:uroporphyrin-III C-methyltransferase/precorrin-2 dehydrogenase/sirohydrochlorin ferrochelatase/uroporphyrin-III C-methyltransferase